MKKTKAGWTDKKRKRKKKERRVIFIEDASGHYILEWRCVFSGDGYRKTEPERGYAWMKIKSAMLWTSSLHKTMWPCEGLAFDISTGRFVNIKEGFHCIDEKGENNWLKIRSGNNLIKNREIRKKK